VSDAIQTAQTDFDKSLPILQFVNSLAETYAGNIYRKVAGTIIAVQTWDEGHPEVVTASQAIAKTTSTFFPAAGVVVPALNLATHVLGALGKLMASDATVAGPATPPGVSNTLIKDAASPTPAS
jgi:hypothetical protein